MKLEEFSAGTWRKQYQYSSFEPTSINQTWTWNDAVINTLLERAIAALGELNAFSLIVPDVDLFIQMHVVKEAHASSRIEGTQTGLDEALMNENQIAPERRQDWREVRNYIDATNDAVSGLNELPLSNRLLRQAHATLMRGVRGEHKQPGDFRGTQNWIGGSSLMDAAFIPPHQDSVPELMSDLEKFWHNDDIHVPHLIRIALSHYQFETIHPFLDGNGRVGRLLIPLYLMNCGLLAKPSLYLSDFFERNRASYYDALMGVRVSNDVVHWVRFFLQGVAETAAKGRDTFKRILELRTQVDEQILTLGKQAPIAKHVMDVFYKMPVLEPIDLQIKLEVSHQTINRTLAILQKLEFVKEITGKGRKRVYAFQPYLELFQEQYDPISWTLE